MNGILGRKLGMTQIFDEAGRRVAVTVIAAGPCQVVQRKTKVRDGYDAVKLCFEPQKESRLAKAQAGEYGKAGIDCHRLMREFPCDAAEELAPGARVTVEQFEGVGYVDVVGTSKGRGFAGVVKRYNMAGGPMTHGGHSKRRVGSIGQCSFPARVMKGQKMPGHMGHVRVTQQNLKLLAVRADENLLLVQGAIPGPNGGVVIVQKALKKAGKTA
ncbi:MAG: 50S ribosomal protein L3 [Kiritimatiellia bacterium]